MTYQLPMYSSQKNTTDNLYSLERTQKSATGTKSVGSFTADRLSKSDYFKILLSLTHEPVDKAREILIECLPAWLKVICSFDKQSRYQVIRTLNTDNSKFSSQISYLLIESINSMDCQSRKNLWKQIGPEIEEFLNQWKREAKTSANIDTPPIDTSVSGH